MTLGTSNLCHDDLEVIVSDETVDGSFERHMTWFGQVGARDEDMNKKDGRLKNEQNPMKGIGK